MRRFPRIAARRLFAAALCLISLSLCSRPASAQLRQISVRHIRVLDSKVAVEIEVEASDRITPQTQILTGPDRLVVDFPNAVPGSELRSQSVLQGEVKDIRVGLFQAEPPVTRIVLDLTGAAAYQVFPGQPVIIKVMSDANEAAAGDPFGAVPSARSGLVAASYPASNYTSSNSTSSTSMPSNYGGGGRISGLSQPHAAKPTAQIASQPAVKPLDVWFRDGLLKVKANKATLSEVLFAVQQRTGAEIGIIAGAEQEQVVVDLGPAPAPEVLSQLLNGSKFNFLIVSAPNDPRRLDRVILSQRNENMIVSRAPIPMPRENVASANNNQSNNQAEEDEEAMRAAPPQPSPQMSQPNPTQPESRPEANNPSGDNPQQPQ